MQRLSHKYKKPARTAHLLGALAALGILSMAFAFTPAAHATAGGNTPDIHRLGVLRTGGLLPHVGIFSEASTDTDRLSLPPRGTENPNVPQWAALRPFVYETYGIFSNLSHYSLYPLFSYHSRPLSATRNTFRWNVLHLLRHEKSGSSEERFWAFPFIFYKDSAYAPSEYLGIFPLWGNLKGFLGIDEIKWRLFPVSVAVTEGHFTRHSVLWPFVQWERPVAKGGAFGASGFALWPLGGQHNRYAYVTEDKLAAAENGDATAQQKLKNLHANGALKQTDRTVTLTIKGEKETKNASAAEYGAETQTIQSKIYKRTLSTNTYALWPFIYHYKDQFEQPTPRTRLGVLPFYAREQGTGLISETYLWPLFGYTNRTLPTQYKEVRYLWPFYVQGRGEDHYINRWAPFYSHSEHFGITKKWIAWPFWKYKNWEQAHVNIQQRQLLYVLFWQQTQHSLEHPEADPASVTHLWPLLSHWKSGGGHTQWQVVSPLEPFFPHNKIMRGLYTPVFSLLRYDSNNQTGRTRLGVLWDLIEAERTPAAQDAQRSNIRLKLGPLLEMEHQPGKLPSFSLLSGLLGYRSAPEAQTEANETPERKIEFLWNLDETKRTVKPFKGPSFSR